MTWRARRPISDGKREHGDADDILKKSYRF